MNIGGLQKLTLLDYPGLVACTVFTAGCNFRCPYCHNSSLLVPSAAPPEDVFTFLDKRKHLLDGIVVSGGEPLLQPQLRQFLQRIRENYPLRIKIDTNGSRPRELRALMEEKLVDYVAMDLKNSREKYALTTGCGADTNAIDESIALLIGGQISYEFRTTVVRELHVPEDFSAIGKWIAGAQNYYLQRFRDAGDVLTDGLHPPTEEQIQTCLRAAQQFIPHAILRG